MRLPLDHFDLIARWYDRVLGRPPHERLLRLLDARPGQRLLDVGGGTGRATALLAAAGVQVIVCDTSRRMVEQARAKGLPAVLASVTRLPFPAASADRLLVVDAFHHFVAPSPAVAQAAGASELLRVLKPGGRLLIQEPDCTRRGVKPVIWMERVLMMGSRFLDPAEMTRVFEAAGARRVAEERDHFNVWLVFSR
ncbi:MAG: Demethylrebeccamycin-D-glucose O-methyltransferase [Chloroflexi bacterium ADurb.Bin325]|nr:MAG: Demethylrebeccamycin-D-glucose O-methyltransferase [Chloroflexi bacterium ADurb.Bin325]